MIKGFEILFKGSKKMVKGFKKIARDKKKMLRTMKLIKISFSIILLGVCSYAGNSKYFNPSVKVGMNVSWITSTKFYLNTPEEHYLHPKIITGIGNEMIISKSLFLQTDFLYRESYSSFEYAPGAAIGPLYQHYENKYLQIGILPGYKIKNYFKIILGTEISMLIDSKFTDTYKKDKNSFVYKSKNITSDLQNIDYSLSFGVLKNLQIYNFPIFFEARYSYCLSSFSLKYFYPDYRNHGLYFLMGFSL